ncbi:hypothetical protein BS78_09G168000 [Paspalum vaginatum]|nr:hypothetical protein BS78_09G168000 [Paspalum vaginatum]
MSSAQCRRRTHMHARSGERLQVAIPNSQSNPLGRNFGRKGKTLWLSAGRWRRGGEEEPAWPLPRPRRVVPAQAEPDGCRLAGGLTGSARRRQRVSWAWAPCRGAAQDRTGQDGEIRLEGLAGRRGS